jgi:hypothetical protein
LQEKVNIFQTNNFNYDALDVAIRSDKEDAVRYILNNNYKLEKRLPNTINPYTVAIKFNRTSITRILKKYQIPEFYHFGFDRVTISASEKLTSHDLYTGLDISLKEPKLNGGIIAGVDFKPGYTRVLMKVNDKTFYQYKDKSAMVYGGIFKDFALTDNPFTGNWILTISASGAYGLGNKLVGTDIVPWNKFLFIPSAGIKREGNRLAAYASLDYMKTKFYKVGPVWVRLGLAYSIFFDNTRAPWKNIKWYNFTR